MNKKVIIIFVIVAVIGFVAYKYFSKNKEESKKTSDTVTQTKVTQIKPTVSKAKEEVKKTVLVTEPTKAQNLLQQAEPKLIKPTVTTKQNVAKNAAQSKGTQLYRTQLVEV